VTFSFPFPQVKAPPTLGNLLSCIFSPQSVQVGASGSIYGLLGIQLVELLHVRDRRRDMLALLFVVLFGLPDA
jgi:membrane associated rhomboid family serine protease